VRTLVAVGFAAAATGLGRVMERILTELAPVFDVHWLALGHKGGVARRGEVWLHPSNVHGGDVFGVEAGRALADELGAEVVLLYNDLWLVEKYQRTFDHERRPRVVAYCPVDGRIVDDLAESVDWVDDLVVYTEFARRQLPGAHVIGHGVDDPAFEPIDRSVPSERFAVLNANRLQPRKRIDITIDAFELFAADRADAELHLHHAIVGMDETGWVTERVAASPVCDRIQVGREPLSRAELNALYSRCNVGLNTAMGEGWGLVSFEHALTGAAQVVPRHSACEELWDGAAEMVDPVGAEMPPFARVEMQTVSASDVAAALARLYDDREFLEHMSAAAQARASEPRFSWKAVGAQWRELLAGGR